MLLLMSRKPTRELLFTLIAFLSFMAGCAGAFEEGDNPRTANDYATNDGWTWAGDESASSYESATQPATQSVAYDGSSDTDPAALTMFRNDLEPYGTWVDDGSYGTVWVPSTTVVGTDFAPYVSAGHWSMTDQSEWIWVSDYPFGWATFHYGRWVWIPARGWSWIPGRAYAPAWVVWRTGYNDSAYIGWAPMPPTYYWSGGMALSLWVVPPAPYVFCSTHYVFAPHVHHHIITGSAVRSVAPHTRPYQPANPGRGAPYAFARPTRGPTLAEARIPKGATPTVFARPEPRALAAAHPRALANASSLRPSTTLPAARSLGTSQFGAPSGPRPMDMRHAPVTQGPRSLGITRSTDMGQPVYRGQATRTMMSTPATRYSSFPSSQPSSSYPSYRAGSFSPSVRPSFATPTPRPSSRTPAFSTFRPSPSPVMPSPSVRTLHSPSMSPGRSFAPPPATTYRPPSTGGLHVPRSTMSRGLRR